MVLLAVLIYKMPDSILFTSNLLSAGWDRRKVAHLRLLFTLTTSGWRLTCVSVFSRLSEKNIAVAIGISFGTFLALATVDIFPQVHRINARNPFDAIVPSHRSPCKLDRSATFSLMSASASGTVPPHFVILPRRGEH